MNPALQRTKVATRRTSERSNRPGEGHLYQSRFKSFPIADDAHFLVICRYVERNALRADLVERAEDWPYSSLWRWIQPQEPDVRLLTRWPIARSPNWVDRVNQPLTDKELEAVRTCVQRGRPFGTEDWIREVVKRCGLGFTLRARGRPRKDS